MVDGGKLRGTIMVNIAVVSLWSGIYTTGENYSNTLLYNREMVSRTQQSLIEEKRCQRTLSEKSALGWDLCVQIHEPFLSKLKTLNQTQLNEHARNRLPMGWAKEPGPSSQAVCSGVKAHFGRTALPISVSPQASDGHVPYERGTGFGEGSSLCLWVFSAWGHNPTALPASGAARESPNPLWTHSALILKGPKGCASADCPEVRQGAALSSSLDQLCAGTSEPARASHGLEAEMMVFQPKSVRDVFPQHEMALKPASATFDNRCLFSKCL